ncbi:DUF2635 domain-containing protein [Roseicella sp. DB1501]|uniref:DUF2635 domain-containing protein n=1 Tax=Roseicella sp. DB1501 TaxID=2730925 RepID=UPI001491C626|nr:DUF2635 domain-containing protein [Roseicella sp. DB1501]NOG69811.1 DUF2635 domain-containing protein [Roseicella sp. DB1501]
MQVKPAAGLLVIDPETGMPLSADGADVEMTEYWQRRLADGDVVTAVPEPAPAGAINKKTS